MMDPVMIPQGFPLMIHPVTDSAELYLVIGWKPAGAHDYIPIVVSVGGRVGSDFATPYDGAAWKISGIGTAVTS
jgi:hypothetical protein